MKEIRKNHPVSLKAQDGTIIKGIVQDYINDRILIKISDKFLEDAKKINELDEFNVAVDTHLGIKNMVSCVISELDKNNCLIIENNDAFLVEQKREFVRVSCDFDFIIEQKEKMLNAKCTNISAGGMAFKVIDNVSFNPEETLNIQFFENVFQKLIKCKMIIIKENKGIYTAKFLNLSPHDEDKIVKYVFSLITKK